MDKNQLASINTAGVSTQIPETRSVDSHHELNGNGELKASNIPEDAEVRGNQPDGAEPENEKAGELPRQETVVVTDEQSLKADHPEGNAIRKQVEFYFSDGNLANDVYLLGKCGGRENIPVSLKSICGFPKMRKYKPFTKVVAALKRSYFLEVVDGKKIRRRLPLRGPTINDLPDGEDSEIEDVVEEKVDAEELKKARDPPKKMVPESQDGVALTKGMLKPTGFEDFYADAPITPWDAKEEKEEMYPKTMSFENRIEIAIHRYRERRKFHSEFAALFEKWMNYGGVTRGLPQYVGDLTSDEFMGFSKADRILLTCRWQVGNDKDGENWHLDFVGVVRGFLSTRFLELAQTRDAAKLKRATNILRNFYNYLIMHDVCPEYNDDLVEAKRICDRAEKELPKMTAAKSLLPGHFGDACGLLCDPEKKHRLEPSNFKPIWGSSEPLDAAQARIHFYAGLAAVASNEVWEQVEEKGEEFIKSIKDRVVGTKGFEVIEIHMPSEEAVALASHDMFKRKIGLSPLGKVICKPWIVPSPAEVDTAASAAAERAVWSKMTTKQQEEHLKIHRGRWLKQVIDTDERYEFWLEENILEKFIVGMKLEGEIHELNIGVLYFDGPVITYSTFFEALPNELEMDLRNDHSKAPIFFKSEKEVREEEGRKKAAMEVAGNDEVDWEGDGGWD